MGRIGNREHECLARMHRHHCRLLAWAVELAGDVPAGRRHRLQELISYDGAKLAEALTDLDEVRQGREVVA